MRAAFPGSFDPPTFGHLDLIRRGSLLFDELTVLVAENRAKRPLLDAEERAGLLKTLLAGMPNVRVGRCTGLVVDFMRERGIRALLRGVRNTDDFRREADLCYWNARLAPEVETVLLPPRPQFAYLSSSAARELLAFGKDVSMIVPPAVREALEKRPR